ncbi:TIGR01459 family HAD-type hydrolase [Bradyrhizobium sp. SZCCHNS3004]|uniref:TIGR01459 family HAD-type hydrolase n=1 Tax=Bradyrhizobium sp. SZCCHNS3004 TaxID=3057312 RepID=UPI002916604A|nr:TIGR01459 family HAD-type hydrolase [Bradyrhizobium sp. SZCCHNS3004]
MTRETLAIAGLSAIADRFDHVLLDQWGTLHEGGRIFPAARDCMAKLREAGKHVLVLSNSGKRARSNAERLARLGLPPSAYDGILTSGEVTWQGLRNRTHKPFTEFGHSCFLITRGSDRSIVDGLNLAIVADVREADFVLLAGVDDERAEPDRWRECFSLAIARGLPMLCANPDLKMFGEAGLVPAPGALARVYEQLGGAVRFVGKPHAPIFEAALERLGHPDPRCVLMVGDSLDHDVAGGRAAGMLTLLLSSGVHRDFLATRDIDELIRKLAGSRDRMPNWIMGALTW